MRSFPFESSFAKRDILALCIRGFQFVYSWKNLWLPHQAIRICWGQGCKNIETTFLAFKLALRCFFKSPDTAIFVFLNMLYILVFSKGTSNLGSNKSLQRMRVT
jgi:hypothetical protein